jgi:hypothetical protein
MNEEKSQDAGTDKRTDEEIIAEKLRNAGQEQQGGKEEQQGGQDDQSFTKEEGAPDKQQY